MRPSGLQIAMLESPRKLLDRQGGKILALKLLALVAAKRTLARGIQDPFGPVRRDMSLYTPGHERVDRQQIDELLQGSVPTGQRALTS